MNVIKSYFSEKFIEGYVKAPLTLKEQMLTKVAAQLCHSSELKKAILCSSEPLHKYNYCDLNEFFENQWEVSIEKQSRDACKMLLPHNLETKLIARIHYIALQLLYWSKQYQNVLDVSSEFADNFLMPSDWTCDARLNEEKVAERLVKDERIQVCHRYRLACVYFLKPSVISLWDQLSLEQQTIFRQNGIVNDIHESALIRLWSRDLVRNGKLIGNTSLFWDRAFDRAVEIGLRIAVICCWKKLSEDRRHEVAIKAIRSAVEGGKCRECMEFLSLSHYITPLFPSPHEDIVCFLLSQMREEERTTVFEDELEAEYILKCFLKWPYQDTFLPTINKLWNVLPESTYVNLLFFLVTKCKCIQDYDYGSLLIELLSQTPEPYKRYIFRDDPAGTKNFSEGEILMLQLVEKYPFRSIDKEVLQCLLQEATDKKNLSTIFSDSKFPFWEEIILSQNVELVDCILKQCSPVNMIVDFKKKFFHSKIGHHICFLLLRDHEQSQVEMFLDWGGLSTEKISEFKFVLFYEDTIQEFYTDLEELQIDCMDRILQWCLPLENDQKQYKEHFVQKYGTKFLLHLINEADCDELLKFLKWCLSAEGVVERFKEIITFPKIIEDAYCLLAKSNRWQYAEVLLKWFRLPPEQINRLKKKALFKMADYILSRLQENDYRNIRHTLRRYSPCDKEIARTFQEELRRLCELRGIDQDHIHKLDILLEEVLSDLA